jgi:hypothetical protein
VCGREPEGEVDEADEDGDFDPWPDDAGEGLARGDAEDADRDGDRELEVVLHGDCGRVSALEGCAFMPLAPSASVGGDQ